MYVRLTFVDLNPVKSNYYPFMISLDKCNGSCNVADGLSTNICVSSKTKDLDIKVFNLKKRINEAKKLVKLVSCDCKFKFNGKICKSNQKMEWF